MGLPDGAMKAMTDAMYDEASKQGRAAGWAEAMKWALDEIEIRWAAVGPYDNPGALLDLNTAFSDKLREVQAP